MRILHLIASVDPAGGGPIEYAQTVSSEFSRRGHESIFITLDDPNASWAKSFPFTLHATGPARGLLQTSSGFAQTLLGLTPSCDCAIVHGLWNFSSIGGYDVLTKNKIPWVIFSHGMLDPYFRKIKPIKHIIKQAYWSLWQGRMLSDAAAVLFTCAEEQELARHAFVGHQRYNARVVAFCAADQIGEAADLPSGADGLADMVSPLKTPQYWLFLSRIHPKKGIDNLIKAYARVADRDDCPHLVIAGPDSVGWQSKLKKLAFDLGVAGRVHFPGMLRGASKAAAFARAEAFVLPSHQENFGLVVAEALSAGTPVLISDKVNIWREIVDAGAGLSAPDTVEDTWRLLKRYLDLPSESKATMRAAARPCYERHFSAQAAAADLLDVLISVRKE